MPSKKSVNKKRSSYLIHDAEIPLTRSGLKVWGYDKNEKFVCRVHVNSAGLALYSGTTGNKLIADVSWEFLVKRLQPKQRKT